MTNAPKVETNPSEGLAELVETIRNRAAGDIPRYRSSDLSEEFTELTMADVAAYGETRDGTYVSINDDWTLTSTDKLSASLRQYRAEHNLFVTEGVVYFGTISPSGFGPEAPETFGGEGKAFTVDGTEVIVTIPADDVDELRSAAGLATPASHGGRISSAHTYSDWLSAARITTPDEDDAFDAHGLLMWESLSDYDTEDDTESMEAWWE